MPSSINQSIHISCLGQTAGNSGHVIGHHTNLELQKSNTAVSKACMTQSLSMRICVMHTLLQLHTASADTT